MTNNVSLLLPSFLLLIFLGKTSLSVVAFIKYFKLNYILIYLILGL